jgi:hypothetical protein
MGNVKKLMDNGLLSVCFAQSVKAFRNNFDNIGRGKVQSFLPDLAKSMNASYRTPRFRTGTSKAENELRNDMEKIQAIHDLISKLFNVRSFYISYRHLSQHFHGSENQLNTDVIKRFPEWSRITFGTYPFLVRGLVRVPLHREALATT